MNKTLVCEINMFIKDQTLIYPDGNKERVPLKELSSYIPIACYSNDCDTVHFFGDEKFVNGLINNLETNFSSNNIKIEVN